MRSKIMRKDEALSEKISRLRTLALEVEQGKRLIALILSKDKYEVWRKLTSQRKKLAVFQCWENGWLYWTIGNK
jgi:hypothetical protein